MTAAGADWDLYRSFLAVLDAGSLSGAARRLGTAQPTIGRHIEALEQALGGVALFTRSPGGLRPTDTALALRPHAQAMAAAAEALVRTASGDGEAVAGVIRLTVAEVIGVEVLAPLLADFHAQYPAVVIELVLSNRQEDLLRRDADVAIRMARPTQDALFARRLGVVPLRFHAHRSYLQRRGVPHTLADLREHSLIGYDRGVMPESVRAALPAGVTLPAFTLRTDNELAQLAAIRAGFGVGVCQPAIAARDPNLVPLLVDVLAFDLEVWVVMHEDLKSVRRMRRLFDHLCEGMAAWVAENRL